MISFGQYLREQLNPTTSNTHKIKTINDAPNNKWEALIDRGSIKFDSMMRETDLTVDDKAFIVALFDHYKSVKQLRSNVFTFTSRSVTFRVGFFKNRKWAASLEDQDTRQVTEQFTITDVKIRGMIAIFDNAIKSKSFKGLLPVVRK